SQKCLDIDADALVVNLFQSEEAISPLFQDLDIALNGIITTLIRDQEIDGKIGKTSLIYTLGLLPVRRVLIVGLGKRKDFNLDVLRRETAEACRSLRRLRLKKIGFVTSDANLQLTSFSNEELACTVTEGCLLGLYRFDQYKTKNTDQSDSDIENVLIVDEHVANTRALKRGVKVGSIIAEGVALARDMVNEPANVMTPTRVASIAENLAEMYDMKCTVFDRDDCDMLGMGAFLGIAQGSNEPPKFIILEYKGDIHQPENNLALIGKGITFDSGGISLKPAAGMASMKSDMAGAASVFGAIKAIAQLKPKINVVAVVAATENLPSGHAVKPGDILTAMNGKSIEIDNTDAEGRVTLADAVSYAKRLGFTRLLDVATLTGAIRAALGNVRMGLFTNNQEFADQVLEAGRESGEGMWMMPMDSDYKQQNHSNVADIKNTGGVGAGSITAAQFIGEFTAETPWVHLDIAAVAMSGKNEGYLTMGATGSPVRSLIKVAQLLSRK
ncbi:leucyl aminopeptidase, partial [SAR202 cluster bacterium AD-802-E10_MRT_200m]|nr:leucyl aminopeptidase [SAR202 cluster bacterium AD-802-E10_MRT_200m]